MLCTTILSLFLGCTEPANQKQEYKTEERSYKHDKFRDSRRNTKGSKRTTKSSKRCGQASWYGKELAGRRTANGERFRPSGLTAASWFHGFGTRVTVSNPKNGRSVTVRINDRGPARWTGRIIDLSEGAFREIAQVSRGLVRVCIN